jgi:3-oxoacyl-[acyl-carrier-protein] synthase II
VRGIAKPLHIWRVRAYHAHSMARRVVITGMSMITPLGAGLERTWDGLLEGRSATARLTRLDASRFKACAAGEVRDFEPGKWIEPKALRRMGRFTQFAIVAARNAWSDAGLALTDEQHLRAGCVLGNASGGIPEIEAGKEILTREGPSRLSPHMMPQITSNQAPGQVAIDLGLRGPISCVVTACSSGNNAIGMAARFIRDAQADVMVSGGTEASLAELCYGALDRVGAISREVEDPGSACRPFDLNRGGMVPAEGAGILVLEEESCARRRGARIYAEVLGCGNSCDAFHTLAPAPDGSGVMRCIVAALRDAGIDPAQVSYINAHGTGTKLNDEAETIGVKAALGHCASAVPVSSTKSMLGHMLGGSGGAEAVISALAISRGAIPPTINYETPDPACDLDYVPNTARETPVAVALSNSFGFGGTNATLILGRYSG